MWLKLLIPFIAAFIGYLTNVIAIKLLFHPYKKIAGIQGLLPKYRNKAAERLGATVKEYLLDSETLVKSINTEENIKQIISQFITKMNKVNPMRVVLQNLIDPLAIVIKDYIERNLKDLPNTIQVDKIIADKVKNFDFMEMEKIIYKASGPEIRFIQLSGAILGFIIGWLQVVLTMLI